MDFTNLDFVDMCEKGVEFIPFHPITDKPLDMSINVSGSDSDKFKDVMRELEKMKAVDESLTVQDNLYFLTSNLINCWKNVEKGQDQIDFTPEAATELFKEQDWLFRQLKAFIDNPSNFFLAI